MRQVATSPNEHEATAIQTKAILRVMRGIVPQARCAVNAYIGLLIRQFRNPSAIRSTALSMTFAGLAPRPSVTLVAAWNITAGPGKTACPGSNRSGWVYNPWAGPSRKGESSWQAIAE